MKIKDYIWLTFFTMIFQMNIYSQGSWEHLPGPTDKYLRSVHFTDSLHGWAAGDSGIIIHTSDGGLNWIEQDSNTDNNIYDLFFLDRNLGWAISWELLNLPAGTYILKTTDGGDNWVSSAYPEENIFAQRILFLDTVTGWIAGKPNPSPIKRTTDGGNSWTDAVIDSSTYSLFPVYDIQFYGSKFGYASGGHIDCCGITWWTTDGGDYWYVADTPYIAPEPIYKLHIKDSLNVTGVGGDFEPLGFGVGITHTSDGGLTWNFGYIGIPGVAWDIDFRTVREVWAPLGGEKKLIYSLDGGLKWNPVDTPDSVVIYKLTFPDSLHGFGVGGDGAIIKYIPPVINNLSSLKNEGAGDYKLHQNYPNPFNPETRIKYFLPEEGFIKLAVYNLLGEEVTVLVNINQESGTHEIKFNAADLPGGVYLYSMEASGFRASKKMVILR